MKVELRSDFPVTDEVCKSATDKTFGEWFAVIDAKGGATTGRRDIGQFLLNDCKVDLWWATTINIQYEAHKGMKEKDGRGKGYFICSTKTISAPVSAVYALWETADALSGWFGEGTTGAMAEGSDISNPDGNKLSVKRVRADKDLRFAWTAESGDESLVDVQFTDKGGKTGILVNHDRIQTREEADGLRRAWGEALDRLKKLSEGK